MERALKDSESRFRRVVESNILAIFLWEPDGRIDEANDEMLKMFDYTREDLAAGRLNWRRMTPPEWDATDARALASFMAGKTLPPPDASESNMKVFLTGATGYIGSSVAERLQQSGHIVLGLARNAAAAEKLTAKGMVPQMGGLLDRAALTAAASAADAVIHAASTNDAGAPVADRVAIEALLEVLRGSSKPLIYTSGVWVLGNTGDYLGDEDTPLDPLPMVAWRVPVELLVLASAAERVCSAVIRPAIVHGRAGGIPAMMLASAKAHGAVQYVGDGSQRWPAVHIDDLADLYLRILTGAGAGTLWHAAHGPSTTAREIAVAVSQVAGFGGKADPWPLEEARRQLGSFADALALDQQVSGKRAERLLGWRPVGRSPIEEITLGSYAE